MELMKKNLREGYEMSYILFFVVSIVVVWGILEYFGVGNDR